MNSTNVVHAHEIENSFIYLDLISIESLRYGDVIDETVDRVLCGIY